MAMLVDARRRQLHVLLMIALDTTVIAAAFTLAYLLRFTWEVIPASDSPPAGPYFAIVPVIIPLWVAIFAANGLYRERAQGFFEEAFKVASGISVGMMAILGASFFYRDFSYSRLWVAFSWVLALTLMLVSRGAMRAVHRRLRARGIDVRRVLIVGAGPEGAALAGALGASPHLGYRPVAYLDTGDRRSADGLPVVGKPEDVLKAVRRLRAGQVMIALPPEDRTVTMRVAALCQEAGVPFAIVPDLYTMAAAGADIEVVGQFPLLMLRGSPLEGRALRIKDALDILGAALGLMLALPLFAIIAVIIVLDSPGPLFYRQARIGRGGVPFRAWKFRTMSANADAQLAQDPTLRTRFEEAYKLVDDPRVTRVGRWIRRTSLDELPQLINVLKGEMSLVGPRPIVEEELAKYGTWERRLLCVKPGLTGLWQVHRNGEPDYAQRVSLDMYYIDHWSVGLDLKILVRTLPSVIAGRGAY
jgi:exopolysaccharide biosynthesis polyprenyl glycosylphosphotransferase